VERADDGMAYIGYLPGTYLPITIHFVKIAKIGAMVRTMIREIKIDKRRAPIRSQ